MVSTAFLLGARHLKGGCGEQAGKFACYVHGQGTQGNASIFMFQTGCPIFPSKGGLVAGRASDRENKMLGKEYYCCGDPKSGIKPPVTPFINGNKARKKKKKKKKKKKTLKYRLYMLGWNS